MPFILLTSYIIIAIRIVLWLFLATIMVYVTVELIRLAFYFWEYIKEKLR